MTMQCAPCLSDLALVRDAVTSIGGTATCTAHAVLLRHPSDDPGRRRKRLADLRTLAESRVVDATGTEKDRLELLVQEYAVAEAMDLGAPDRTGPGRGSERSRRGKERPPREGRDAREPREGREAREGRPPRHERGRRPESGDAAAPAAGSDVLAAEGGIPAVSDAAPATDAPASPASPASPATAADGPATSSDAGSAAPEAGSAPAESAPAPESAPTSAPAPESAPAAPQDAPGSSEPLPARDDSAFGTPDLP